MIPDQYKLLACGVALVGAMAAAGTAGWMVNGLRLDAAHQKEMAKKRDEYDALAEKVREQNRAVEAMGAAKVAADERRKTAEKFAASAIARAQGRSESVASSTAPDCSGVMREAWEAWK